MKYYCADSEYVGENDVVFGELIDEATYKKYQYLQENIGSFYEDLGFDDDPEDEFDLLSLTFKPIPEEDAAVLEKYKLPHGQRFIDNLFYDIDMAILEDPDPEDTAIVKGERYSWEERTVVKDDLLKVDFDIFKRYIDKYMDAISKAGEPSEDYGCYDDE